MDAGERPYHPEQFPDQLRVSDEQREAVAEMVQAALSEGRLELTELDDRLSNVYDAKTHGELATVIRDLVPKPAPAPVRYQPAPPPARVSDKAILPAFILCVMFGIFGAHVFYTGPLKMAALRLVLPFTGIGAPVAVGWWFVDFIMLTIGRYQDGDGKTMRDWI